RPVLVRLHVRLDGRPLGEVWEDFLKYLFASLDADSDGVLSRAEAERTPPPPAVLANGYFGGVTRPTPCPLGTQTDGRVTLEGLKAYYGRQGGHPFLLPSVSQPASPPGQGRRAAPSSAMPLAEDLTAALFTLLDTDGDGKLSKAELAAAPAVLLRLDADED